MLGTISLIHYTPWGNRRLPRSRIVNSSSLLPASQDCSHRPRATTTMHYGNDNDWLFFRRIRDKKFAHNVKTEGAGSKVWSNAPLTGKRHEITDRIQNFPAYTFSRKRTILGNKFPDLRNVLSSARVNFEPLVSLHLGKFFLSRSSSRWRKPSKNASPSMGFTRPLFMSS